MESTEGAHLSKELVTKSRNPALASSLDGAGLCDSGASDRLRPTSERVAELNVETIQQRKGRWALADPEGKGRCVARQNLFR
jgi:hypothetical protein